MSLKEHILQLEKSLLEPSTHSDPAKLGALMAESFFEFGSSGNIWHKRKYTGPGGIGVREMALTDFEMHPLADGVVLATCRVDDRTRKQQTLRSSIWKYTDRSWKMVFHQGTVASSK